MRKKLMIAGTVLAVLVAAAGVFLTVDVVKAQTPTPENPLGTGQGLRGDWLSKDGGILHDAMVEAFAEKLGMTAKELQARLDDGDTLLQIAEEKDMTVKEFRAAMREARTKAIDQAVADGKLTEKQGEWMKNNGGHMFGRRGGGCGGMMGRGRW